MLLDCPLVAPGPFTETCFSMESTSRGSVQMISVPHDKSVPLKCDAEFQKQ